MQLHGSSQVSPQIALGNESVRARAHTSGVQAAVCFAGVAQLVEHLFCKQVVRGSSPRASSAVGPSVVATGSGARGFRVLTSFALRSDAHAQECVPLRSSRKPRQNAELRGRVIQKRPLVAAAGVSLAAPSPIRSALSLARAASGRLARSASATVREPSESCPSGQREQAVNLPDLSYAGSNPALSTSARPSRASVSISCLGELGSPSAEVNSAEPPPQVLGPQPQNSAGVSFTALSGLESRGTNRRGFCFTDLGRGRSWAMTSFAGVAQLVERQPSKLNVEGSSPFSRSQFFGFDLESRSGIRRASRICNPLATRWTRGSTRVGSLVAGEAEPRTGAERTLVREHRTGGEAKPAAKIPARQFSRYDATPAAHLAQMVEHVLGKDEVTSSILVVGSKP